MTVSSWVRVLSRGWAWLWSRNLPLGLALGGLGFGLALHAAVGVALHRAEAVAEREALGRVDRAAETGVQYMLRNLEGFELYFELLRDMVRAQAENLAILPGVEYRLRSFTGEERFGIFQAGLVDPEGIIRWTNFTGSIAQPLLDRPRPAENLQTDQGLVVHQPIEGRFSHRLGIELTRRITLRDGTYAGVAALALNPELLAAQLRALTSTRGERISLWRDAGDRLATSNDDGRPGERVVAGMRPGPDGRLLVRRNGLRDGDDRFFAVRRLDGAPLFLAVSRPAAAEMAGFEAVRSAVRWSEALVDLLVLASAALAWQVQSRRQARREQVEDQRAELARVLDGVQAAVALIRVEPDGRHIRTYISAGAERLLRVPQPVLAGETGFTERMEPPMTMAERRAQAEVLRRTGQVSFDRQTRCGDGTLRWMRYARSVIGRQGEALEVVALVTDIEQQKAAEANALSSARLATLGELSANLAHEMNQPLGVISLHAETTRLLAEVGDMTGVLRGLDSILAMVVRTRAITDHLRLFARKEDPELETIQLGRVLEGALLLASGSLRAAKIELEQSLPAELPPVRGRQVLLEQVLMNLLLNARDALVAAPPRQRRIRVSAEVATDVVRLVVADNGPGIPAHVLPRLFEPFFTTKPAGQGTGLGLSICHGVLQACGGEISAANLPEGGAAFTLVLQRAGPATAALAPAA